MTRTVVVPRWLDARRWRRGGDELPHQMRNWADACSTRCSLSAALRAAGPCSLLGMVRRPSAGVAGDVVDPSLIISPAVALIGIGVGYLGGVQKGRADLSVERERTAQLREGRDEERRKRREAAYHDLLNKASEVIALERDSTVRPPRINAELAALERLVNGVLAAGAAATHEPAQALLAALRQFDRDAQDSAAYEAAGSGSSAQRTATSDLDLKTPGYKYRRSTRRAVYHGRTP